MSKAFETIKTEFNQKIAIKAIRKAARDFGSLVEKSSNLFEIKEKFDVLGTTWPVTVEIEVADDAGGTLINLTARNSGFGPIQSRACKSKIGVVKSAIIDELDMIDEKGTSSVAPSSSADEILKYKQLLDAGAITKEEFEKKKKQILGL